MIRRFVIIGILLVWVLPALAQQPLPPPRVVPRVTFTVATTVDDKDATVGDGMCVGELTGVCTLRAAVQEGNSAGSAQIFIGAGLYSITLPILFDDLAVSDDLDITGSISIHGAGRDLVTIDSSILDRVFELHGGAALYLDNLTVSGGDPAAAGACIYAQDALLVMDRITVTDCHNTGTFGGAVGLSNSWAEIRDSLFFANSGSRSGALDASAESSVLVERTVFLQNIADGTGSVARGGAIYISSSHLILRNSTLYGNQALLSDGRAGAIELSITSAHRVLIENSTIINNSSGNRVGGILTVASPPTIRSSIIAGNTAAQTDMEDCGRISGTAPVIRSEGVNFIGTTFGCFDMTDSPQTLTGDPGLLPLGDYGGVNGLQSVVPDVNSPVLDAADPAACPATDQRAVLRPQYGLCDLGAVERAAVSLMPNGGFEPATPGGVCAAQGWKIAQSSDKAVKENPHAGECALRYKAKQGKTGSAKRTVSTGGALGAIPVDDVISVWAWVRADANVQGVMKVRAILSDGTTLTGMASIVDTSGLYQEVAITPIRLNSLRAGSVYFTKVKLNITSTGVQGKWYVDDVAVMLSSDGT